MDLFLVPNDPKHTVLVSPNGVAQYQTLTIKQPNGPQLTSLRRPADTAADSLVAEIEWRCWESPTIVRSSLFRGLGGCVGKKGVGLRASIFLYKRSRFSSTRYFVGDDCVEYKWKMIKGMGYLLIQTDSGEEIARYMSAVQQEGFFAGEKKSVLRIQPCTVDLDFIVLSFIIMEKKRRDQAGDMTRGTPYDEDPQGDGGGSGDGGDVGEA